VFELSNYQSMKTLRLLPAAVLLVFSFSCGLQELPQPDPNDSGQISRQDPIFPDDMTDPTISPLVGEWKIVSSIIENRESTDRRLIQSVDTISVEDSEARLRIAEDMSFVVSYDATCNTAQTNCRARLNLGDVLEAAGADSVYYSYFEEHLYRDGAWNLEESVSLGGGRMDAVRLEGDKITLVSVFYHPLRKGGECHEPDPNILSRDIKVFERQLQ